MQVFVGNVGTNVGHAELVAYFNQYGKVLDVEVRVGWCKVTFEDCRVGDALCLWSLCEREKAEKEKAAGPKYNRNNGGEWNCKKCLFKNYGDRGTCYSCQSMRPTDGFQKGDWTCKVCSNFNFESRSKCNAAGCEMTQGEVSVRIGLGGATARSKAKTTRRAGSSWKCVSQTPSVVCLSNKRRQYHRYTISNSCTQLRTGIPSASATSRVIGSA